MTELTKAWDWDKNKDDIWFTPSEESFYLISRWKEKGFVKFLDLGCGRGRHSIQFAKSEFNVNSVELSDVAINGLNEWAEKENLSISAVLGDMMNLPFDDNTFDCLLAYHVISHTDSKGILKVISEIRRVLKEGGGAENNVPHFFVDDANIKELLKEFKLITVRQTRGGYGYQVWKCTPPNTYRADGMYGQLCVVLTDYNAVITVTSHNEIEYKDILRAMWSDILPNL